MLHSAYELVNPEKNVHLIFIINLGLWIACIIQNVESKVHYSHNSSCCRRSVAPWIIVLLQHTVVTKRVIYKFTFVWYSLKEGTTPGPHHIWRTYTLCPFFGCEKNTDGSGAALMISLASACYGDSRVAKHFLCPNLVFQPIWGWGDLGSFQLPQSNSSPEGAWNLGGYI